jgi:ATP-dependent DNA helicase HFM1/MER3
MGINLPARLVVIKSTQCYRGAGRGYQEYTQIEMDQMMGRAGRPPFDN